MERAIITGATGAVGVALINELISHDIEVLVFCRRESQRASNIPKHPLVTVQYASMNEFCKVENDTGKMYHVFYHLAWEGTTGEARNNMHLQNQNVKYALDAVNMAKRFGCDLFVGIGSQAEYGRKNAPLTETTSPDPENGYGIAKLCAGYMTRESAHQNQMKHVWVRILSVYGPYDNANSLISSAMAKLKQRKTPQLTKGEQVWDYLYSEDAARALYLLGLNGVDGRSYVLGSGEPRVLAEYIKELRDIISPDGSLGFGAVPYGDKQVMYLAADISLLRKDTGFVPKYSFREGILKTAKWLDVEAAVGIDEIKADVEGTKVEGSQHV